MQYATKYVLIPESQWNASSDWAGNQLYQQNLRRELIQHRKPFPSIPVKITSPIGEHQPWNSKPQEAEEKAVFEKTATLLPPVKRKRQFIDENVVLNKIPPAYHSNVKDFLDTGVLDFDPEDGSFLYKNRKVPSSNISLLLSTLVPHTKDYVKKLKRQPGYTEFYNIVQNKIPKIKAKRRIFSDISYTGKFQPPHKNIGTQWVSLYDGKASR